MNTAFPLHWPAGKPRLRRPNRSRFNVGFASARDGVLHEIELLGGTSPIISTNVELRQDGIPYAGRSEPEDSAVAVYFQIGNQPMCFACDRWDLVKDNLQAIRHTICALRGIERWGTGDMVEQAFQGFRALPASASSESILGVNAGASIADIESAFRNKAKTAHPDCGGSTQQMQELLAAKEQLICRLQA